MSDDADKRPAATATDLLATKLDSTSRRLDRATELLTKTSTKLDEFASRMDRMDQQRELDRAETSNLRDQTAGIVAACRLHAERTASAETAALEAAKEAAAARERVIAIESSWNDMRMMTQRKPKGSDEYNRVTAALEKRARTKEEEAAEIERRIAQAASAAIQEAFKVRDEERKRILAEQAEAERHLRDVQAQEDARKAKEEELKAQQAKRRQDTITWAVRLVVATFLGLGGTGLITLWQQAKANQEQTSKTLEAARALQVKEDKVLKSFVKPDASVHSKVHVHPLP